MRSVFSSGEKAAERSCASQKWRHWREAARSNHQSPRLADAKGGKPATITKRTIPADHMSTASPAYAAPRTISGAWYAACGEAGEVEGEGVTYCAASKVASPRLLPPGPRIPPDCNTRTVPQRVQRSGAATSTRTAPRPQSDTRSEPSAATRRFSGFRSRWHTRRACAWANVLSSCLKNVRARVSGNGLPGGAT